MSTLQPRHQPRPDSTLDQVEQALNNHWMAKPSFVLAYLFFVFLPLVFSPDTDPLRWAVSAAACVLFILLFRFTLRNKSRPGWPSAMPALVSAALGFALIPLNPGGNTFVIYAVAMLGESQPIKRAVKLSALLLIAMCLEFVWVMPTLGLALGFSAMVMVISAMVLIGIYFGHLQQRQVAELKRSRDEIQRLAQSTERERIARDLHDLLGHSLSVIALKSELAGKLIERNPSAAAQQISEIEQVTRQALKQVREAVTGYRSDGLAAEVAAARLNLLDADIRLEQHLEPVAMKPDVESTLAIVLREAVTNVLRHSEANQMEIELQQREGRLRLSIQDNGRGLIGSPFEGNGLRGMRERLRAIGAELQIDGSPGEGVKLDVQVASGWQQPSEDAR